MNVGDVVLIKEENCKPVQYPLAIVREVTQNDLGEAVGAVLLKGSTGELVKRHSSIIIPLLSDGQQQVDAVSGNVMDVPASRAPVSRPPRARRAAALLSQQKTREHLKL